MSDHLDTILKELYVIDPTLRERGEDVRAMLMVLMAEKPTVNIDQEFLHSLRTRLTLTIETAPTPVRTPVVSTYFFRFAPLAAMAILLLVLVSPARHPITPPTNESLSWPAPKGVATPGDSTRTGPMVSEDVATFSMLAPELPQTAPTVDSFAVNNQIPGNVVVVEVASLLAPSFFAVHELSENNFEKMGTLLGVSELMPTGTGGPISIFLTKPTRQQFGYPYAVTLFRDNGDGVFSLTTDTPVLDPASVEPDYFPLRIFFEVGTQY